MITEKQRAAKLMGDKVILSPLETKDVKKFHRWVNDMGIAQYLTLAPVVLTLKDEEEWFEEVRKKKDQIVFSIVLKKNNETIGNVCLDKINKTNGSAEFGIMIGDKDCWGEGYGTEAAKLILDFGFNVLRLHSIYLFVYAYNERAIASYKKVGFKVSGKLRESRFFGEEYHDAVIMDILDREFKDSAIKKLVM